MTPFFRPKKEMNHQTERFSEAMLCPSEGPRYTCLPWIFSQLVRRAQNTGEIWQEFHQVKRMTNANLDVSAESNQMSGYSW